MSRLRTSTNVSWGPFLFRESPILLLKVIWYFYPSLQDAYHPTQIGLMKSLLRDQVCSSVADHLLKALDSIPAPQKQSNNQKFIGHAASSILYNGDKLRQ
jgi:hypothetical protein